MPEAVQTAITAAGTGMLADVGDMIVAGLPVGILVLAAGVGWKVFKKFAR